MIRGWSVDYVEAKGLELMRQSCVLTRKIEGNDGSGGVSVTNTVIGSNVPCTLTNKRMVAPMANNSGRITSQYEMILHVSVDQEIAENDTAEIEGELYRVQNVVIDHQWPVYKRCVVERLTGGDDG